MAGTVCGKVAVVGMGSWGTAAAGLLARNAGEVCGWALEDEVARGISEGHRNPLYLPSYELPANVRATSSMGEALDGADAVVVVVPSAFMRPTAERLAPLLGDDVPVCVLTKGVEPGTMMLMTQVVADVCGGPGRMACLSRPWWPPPPTPWPTSSARCSSPPPSGPTCRPTWWAWRPAAP